MMDMDNDNPTIELDFDVAMDVVTFCGDFLYADFIESYSKLKEDEQEEGIVDSIQEDERREDIVDDEQREDFVDSFQRLNIGVQRGIVVQWFLNRLNNDSEVGLLKIEGIELDMMESIVSTRRRQPFRCVDDIRNNVKGLKSLAQVTSLIQNATKANLRSLLRP